MAYNLIGKDFTPPDITAKVTGKAKYSEDFRVEGMVYARLLTSPMPHAIIKRIDASAALAMKGVYGVLTADDVPEQPAPNKSILTNEPMYVGEPILAVAADTDQLCIDAIEAIEVEYEPLEFTVDPLQSLYPGGPNARSDGNVAGRGRSGAFVKETKWSARDFARAAEGQLPMGPAENEWAYGDLEVGFDDSEYVMDETFITQGLSHHALEPRSCLSYWQNGKCFVHGSSQSQSFVMPGLAAYIDVEMKNLVFIAEFCGGGFGAKGVAYTEMAIPAYMSKKINRPVMLRISRAEEYGLGSARPGFQGRIKMGFGKDGRVKACDLYIVQENGPDTGMNDYMSAADAISLVYTPENMRFRGIPVETNTPPRVPQRGPGQNQIACVVEPLLDKAAKVLGINRLDIRTVNTPNNGTLYGPRKDKVTSAYLKEAYLKGAKEFNWDERRKHSGKREGSKVIGVGLGSAYHSAGYSGFDGLVVITPEGKLNIHNGVGNLGTYSHTSTARVAAEVLKMDWDDCTVLRGDSRKHLPWNLAQFGSNTSYTMTRTNYVAATDAVSKLKEIAAAQFGGSVDDYEIDGRRVYAIADASKSMSYGQAAQRAIELGGKFSGQEAPEDLNPMTKASVTGVAGSGLVGVSKDTLAQEGTVPAFAVGFMQIELDLETGKYEITDYVGVADCGTVLHPQGLAQQIKGGAVDGIGLGGYERHVYDPQNGLPACVGLNDSKLPTILDVPSTMGASAVGIADPMNPVGARGIGEPVQGCAAAALLSAISDALGGHYFNRVPVMPDMIVNVSMARGQSHDPLQVNTF